MIELYIHHIQLLNMTHIRVNHLLILMTFSWTKWLQVYAFTTAILLHLRVTLLDEYLMREKLKYILPLNAVSSLYCYLCYSWVIIDKFILQLLLSNMHRTIYIYVFSHSIIQSKCLIIKLISMNINLLQDYFTLNISFTAARTINRCHDTIMREINWLLNDFSCWYQFQL